MNLPLRGVRGFKLCVHNTRDKMYMSTGKSLRVNDVMSSPVITTKEDATINEIAQKMRKHNIGSVVIVNKAKEPIGIVTERDIIRRVLAEKKNPYSTRANDIMTAPITSVTASVTLEEAAKLMVERKIKKLCVTDDDNKTVGVVTEGDIVKNANYLIDVLKDIISAGYSAEQ